MTWTAEVIGKAQDISFVEFAIRYSNGTKTKDELVRASDVLSLKRAIETRLASLEAGDIAISAVQLGLFDPTITVQPPDPADVAFEIWLRKFNRLKKVQELITLSVLTGSEA